MRTLKLREVVSSGCATTPLYKEHGLRRSVPSEVLVPEAAGGSGSVCLPINRAPQDLQAELFPEPEGGAEAGFPGASASHQAGFDVRSKFRGRVLTFPLGQAGLAGVGAGTQLCWRKRTLRVCWRGVTWLPSLGRPWAGPVSSSLAGLSWDTRAEMSAMVIFCRRRRPKPL